MPAPMTMTRGILTLAGQCQYCQLHTSTLECILTPSELKLLLKFLIKTHRDPSTSQYNTVIILIETLVTFLDSLTLDRNDTLTP